MQQRLHLEPDANWPQTQELSGRSQQPQQVSQCAFALLQPGGAEQTDGTISTTCLLTCPCGQDLAYPGHRVTMQPIQHLM